MASTSVSSIYSEKIDGQTADPVKSQGIRSSGWKSYPEYNITVPERYTLVKLIGRGAFGTVFSAKLNQGGKEERVALKAIPIREENILEVKRLVRELYLLRHFDHANIIGLRYIVEPHTAEKFDVLYFATDLMDIDMNHVIKSKQELSNNHVGYFILYLLNGLASIHAANVLHRDLKPSNIVVNADCSLKICDFGLAREQDLEEGMTEYVATRWYRASELLMQWKKYGGSVDIWSIGCIFAELLGRKPLLPGKNYLDQLNLILDLVGAPSEEDFEGIGSERARNYVRHLPKKPKADLSKILPNATKLEIDLLEKMLVFDPHKRWSAKECLAHEYFASYEEPPPSKPTKVFSWEELGIDINNENLTVFDLKKTMFDLMSQFHPEYANFKWWSDEELEQKKKKTESKK